MSKEIQINRNIVWAEAFVDQLVRLGVRYACISPGSRSTPLALACANNKDMHTFVHIDERSGGFFALGIAKNVSEPVMLVCTSGTAAAEFYPAIIEAYQQQVPLIVCTADRPPEFLDCGANQTIDQNNLYGNHIRWFFNAGLPEPVADRLRHIRVIARRAVKESNGIEKGPVHINFPFRKPFEPNSYTDTIDAHELEVIMNGYADDIAPIETLVTPTAESLYDLLSVTRMYERGLIIVGPGDFDAEFSKQITELAALLSYPILADGASQIRFGKHDKHTILTHYDAYLKVNSFIETHKPDVIFQFGGTVSSKGLELFLNEQNAFKVHINSAGKWLDPSNYLRSVVQADPAQFCSLMVDELQKEKFKRADNSWFNDFKNAENKTQAIREEMLDCTDSFFEGKILRVVLATIPDGSHVMVSNSMPIRDLDYFVSALEKNIQLHTNRGASGIDGITSTALGIAATTPAPVYLITGDLAFYHDLNGLIASRKYSIPLHVVLINNNGGGIFELLPIADYREMFKEYFLTPHDIDFENFVLGYGGAFHIIQSWDDLREKLIKTSDSPLLNVFEVKTDPVESTELRKQYWKKVEDALA